MSTAESWNIVAPEDDAALGAELRRHGVEAGREYRVVITPIERAAEVEDPQSNDRDDLAFIGSVTGGPSDLAPRTDEYLSQGFGR